MKGSLRSAFDRLPTAAKLLLLLSAALLPIGLILVWTAQNGLDRANDALEARAASQAAVAVEGMESVIARNALALRIAANGALKDPVADPCAIAARSLALTPAVGRAFSLRQADGLQLCTSGSINLDGNDLLVAPGDIRVWISASGDMLYFKVGVINGVATGALSVQELRTAAQAGDAALQELVLTDGTHEMELIGMAEPSDPANDRFGRQFRLANGQLVARATMSIPRVTRADQLLLLLPLLMWVVAALISWWLVHRLLISPLRRLQLAVSTHQPGEGPLTIPLRHGPATEIDALGQAFERSVERIERSEQEMAVALEGQRRLVREVHHRVKNNLQVVASLLNIHGRNASTGEAKDAYAAIGRRVEALSVVHRNHYAELEENRGIALQPLFNELAAGLRGSAPEQARALGIDLDVEPLNTTQDAAVAAAFLVTEIVEFAMLHQPDVPVEVTLRRSGELTALLSLSSPVLVPEQEEVDIERKQFERIVDGLARQLRSPLDRRLGRYSVDVPVFPVR